MGSSRASNEGAPAAHATGGDKHGSLTAAALAEAVGTYVLVPDFVDVREPRFARTAGRRGMAPHPGGFRRQRTGRDQDRGGWLCFSLVHTSAAIAALYALAFVVHPFR